VTILAIPIGIVEALGITAIATRSLAAVQALKPVCLTLDAHDRERVRSRLQRPAAQDRI
jgi:hypothetical protein